MNKRDMIVTLVFRAADVPEGMGASDIVEYLAHAIEDRDGAPAPETCAAMKKISGCVVGHFAVEGSGPGAVVQERTASRLRLKGPRTDMETLLGRYLEAGGLVGGSVVPVRASMLRRATLSVHLLLALYDAGVSLNWLLSGRGEPLRKTRLLALEARVHQTLKEFEAMQGSILEGLRMARMTAEELAERKSASMTELLEAQEQVKQLSAQLRDADAELASSQFTM